MRNIKVKVIIVILLFCGLFILKNIESKNVEYKKDVKELNASAALNVGIALDKLDIVEALVDEEALIQEKQDELLHLQSQYNTATKDIYNSDISSLLSDTLYTVEEVNVLTSPQETSDSIITLENDSKVEVIALTKNDYYQCLIDEQIGYIQKDLLKEKTVNITATGNKAEYQKYAWSFFDDYGWSVEDFDCLVKLWNRESNWNPSAENSSSGAYGIPQSLPASKMANEGDDYLTNYKTQIRWGLKYIAGRYGTPTQAWAHSERTGWY